MEEEWISNMKCPICDKLFSEIKFHLMEHSKEDIINELVNIMLPNKDIQKIIKQSEWEWRQLKSKLEDEGYIL